MGHDHHFLSRLDRFEPQHLELALSLYRDHRLTRHLLRTAPLPSEAPRVALRLDDRRGGPHIVIARNGHFVTCLARGMSTGSLPIIARAQFDQIWLQVHTLRELSEMAYKARCQGIDVDQTVRRIVRRGDRMSQEEFLELRGWEPLYQPLLLQCLIVAYENLDKLRGLYRHVRKDSAPYDRVLSHYWELVWAVGHLSVLACNEGRADWEPTYPAYSKCYSMLAIVPICQGTMGVALRGLWSFGRKGLPLLQGYMQRYRDADNRLSLFVYGLGLVAVGLCNPKMRAKIRKFFLQPVQRVSKQVTQRGNELSWGFARMLEPHGPGAQSCDSLALGIAQQYYQELTAALPAHSPYRFACAKDVPESLARAALCYHQGDFLNNPTDRALFFVVMPWLVQGSAEQLYFPRALVKAIRVQNTAAAGLLLMKRMRRFYLRSIPVRAPKRPRPNARCECGSGHKFKRCCGSLAA